MANGNLHDPKMAGSGGDAPGGLAPSGAADSAVALGARVSLQALESEHIRRVLALARNLDEAARILGIDPATLYRKRQKLGFL